MGRDLASLLQRIRNLTDARGADPAKPLLTEMEHTLTDGYARALELEASRRRLEKDVTDLAARIANAAEAEALRRMVEGLASADRELDQLRVRLQMLRRRVDGVRAAVAAPFPPAPEPVP